MGIIHMRGKLWLLLLIFHLALGAGAQNINIPNKMGPLGTQVNTLTGNLFIPRNDIYILARSFDIKIQFDYNSFNYNLQSGFGNGWSFAYSIKYRNDTAGSKTILWGDGREDSYTSLGGIVYKSPKGFFDSLTEYQPGKFRLTEVDGTKYTFDNSSHKRITRMEEPNNNFINFNYTDSLLASVVNAAGQTISFTYNAAGLLATVVDAIAAPTRTYTYTYDAAGNLKQVTDPAAGTNKYTYLINGPMKTISDKNNNTIDIIYYPGYTVSELIGCNKRVSFSYDTTNKATVVTDHLTAGNNQVTTYGYKKYGDHLWLSSLTGNCCGFNMSFDFDDNGNKIKETDANGNITIYTYDLRGNMLTMKDPLNQVSTYTYSSNFNELTSLTDNKGNIYTLLYDANGNLTKLSGPGNTSYSVSYSANGDMIGSTDPQGNSYIYSYDIYGNPLTFSGPGGYHGTRANDARGNLLSYTDARGSIYSAQYDILNRLKKIIDPVNNNLQFSYDAQGNIISIINKNNETSLVNYDASNRVVRFTDVTGKQTQWGYDGMDNLIFAKNAIGNATNFTYDTRNQLSTTKDALSNSNTLSYDANGNITNINLPNGQRVNLSYDNINRVAGVSDVKGTIGNYTRDKNNNIISYTNGTGAITSAIYDSLNRAMKITDPLGFVTSLSYDKNDNVVSITDRNGAVVFYTYDSLNRVKTFTDKIGGVVTVSYDVVGNVIQAKDQNNNITTYTYDALNRLNTSTYPDGRFMQYGYDKKNNIISKRLPDGTTINFQYDSLNRIVAKMLPGGDTYSYSYDAISRVVAASNNNGTVIITYDALNRVSSETFDGRTTRYNYDIAGRTQTSIYPDSTTITKSYDTRNRLVSIAKNNTSLVSFQYNNADQPTVKNFGNGVSSNLQYDIANRLSSISTAGGSIQNTLFTYDKERNKTSINRLNNPALSEQFLYDNSERLINYKRGVIGGAPTIQNTYSYDAVGNRISANLNGTSTTYTPNNLNQITNSNSGAQNINFIYDNNGNLTYDGAFYKTYDAEGRLLKDSSSPSNKLIYLYDVFNRRVQKIFNGIPFKYSFSGKSQIEERNGLTNNLIGRTVFNNFYSPVLNENNNNSYYYHQNELNSVEAITNSNGNLIERYQYDAYGKPTIFDSANNAISSSIAGNRFAFSGQEYDSASSSYHFQFRNYSPATGTFNQRDLIGYADGMGMYQYVHNNPANGIDIFGLKDCPPENTGNGTDKEVASNLSKVGNYLSILTAALNKLLAKEREAQKGLGLSDGLAGHNRTLDRQNKGLGILSTATNLAALKAKVDDLSQNYQNMSEKDLNIALGEVELASAGILNDAVLSKVPGAQLASEALAAAGAVDALVSETTGQSLSWWYAHQSDAAEATGSDAQNELNASFNKREQAIKDYARENGTDISTWSMRMKFVYKLHESSKKAGWGKPTQRTNDCPQNGGGGGTQKPSKPGGGITKPVVILRSSDPNEIIGPDGVPTKQWVSVKDRLPYTILYENSLSASAPAKFVRITSPIEPKEDAATFQLGNFGFNNITFAVPPSTIAYYERLDVRDSLGLYVDVTAGYDQINNVAFWEFQSIDPITLLPPTDPLKGFLLLQDSTKPLNGHGFVNFSVKPIQTAITLDTIGARALIVFDTNDTIPTNIYKNTIDAFAPTSHMNALPATTTNPITLSWTGADDTNGSGIDYYTIYVSNNQVNFSVLIPKITRTDTTLSLPPDSSYCFFVLATDRVGNKEVLRLNEIKCTSLMNPLPISWLYFNGTNQGKNNLLNWATASEQNSKQFDVERSLSGTAFGRIGTVNAAGNSSQTSTYQYTDRNIDKLNSPVMLYRLKEIDINGSYRYSNIVRLNYNQITKVNSIVYPNPTPGMITILVGDNSLVGSTAVLADVNGRILENIRITANSQSVNLAKYVNGIYFIKMANNESLKIVKE